MLIESNTQVLAIEAKLLICHRTSKGGLVNIKYLSFAIINEFIGTVRMIVAFAHLNQRELDFDGYVPSAI